jgi:ABC-2 type transport system permease protein
MRLVRAEAVKLLATRRTLLGFGLALLALVALGAVGELQSGRANQDTIVHDSLLDALTTGAGASVFVALILGALVSTWEYQHKVMTHTLLAAPWRDRVIGAKAAIAVALGAALAVVAVVLALVIAILWLGGDSVDELATGELWLRIGRLLLAAGLWAALGAMIGALLASQVGAIAAMLLWLLVAEPLTGGLVEDVGPYLPGRSIQALVTGDDDALAPAGAFGMTVAYVAVFAVAGILATRRRDIV